MSSLRLRIVGALIRPVVRAVMSRVENPAWLRRQFERVARRQFRETPFALVLQDEFAGATGAMRPALWVSSGPCARRRVILYLHGGGYILGSPQTHRKLAARLSRLCGLRAFLPSYRLAPEHPIPAGLDDARAAHAALLARGYRPGDIVIGGDSAGGGLALALTSQLCLAGTPPAAVFAWSPFTDQSFSGASVVENGRRDHFFPGWRAHELADMILGDTPADDPRASPLFAAFPNCPPVLLQASTAEILRDDAVRMQAHLRQQGIDARLELWDDVPHAWQVFDGWFPEARAAIRRTANFIAEQLDAGRS